MADNFEIPPLPVDMTSMVGRLAEAAEVTRLVGTTRLVTLTGLGGVGKTRLAIHVARSVFDEFLDGAVLVELADVADPALVALTVAQVVGAPIHQADVVATLIDYLRRRQLLLVLDNCEHLVDESAVLARNLLSACADLRILVTSREPLRVTGEQLFEVQPLAVASTADERDGGPSDAVALFAERAAATAPGFAISSGNAATVEELCRRLDGLPLAIELAAGRMRSLSPGGLLSLLDDHHRLLSVGDRSAAPRHRSLWATLDWSYQLCSPYERTLWGRLAVFTGAVQLSTAECVCSGKDLPREAVLEGIAALVDKSLLVRIDSDDRPAYRMLDTVREYGLRKLREGIDESDVLFRYRRYYQRLAREFDTDWFGPGQEQMVDRMRREQANLRAVLDGLISDAAGGRPALSMAAAMFWYWICSGQQREGRHWLDRALAACAEPSSERAAALWANGYLAQSEGKAVVSLQLLRSSQDMAEELGDAANFAHATHMRGIAEHNLGNTSLGGELLERGCQLEAVLGPSVLSVLAQEQLGWVYCRREQPDRALEIFGPALATCVEHGDRWAMSWILTFTGLAHWMRGEHTRAAEVLREALEAKRRFQDALGIAVVIEILSWVSLADRDAGRAATLMGAVRRIWHPLGDYPGGFELGSWSELASGEARKVLGNSEFDALLANGGRLDTCAAICFALGEKGFSPESAPTGDGVTAMLTRRELQVAELIVRGMTNKQIARELTLAPRTIDSHVEHIFAKLHVNSRTQVAVLLARTES
ncbi:putative ATPase [Mycobacteroides abscessus subsp. bolletii]|uniref:LuxR C-terminal-related transcriptional regulator n=1 Tax=Mycobacteroides abscessus TaxID=36809 RepID=UPI0009D279AD|nr:LuxR C-terminal-related transcriptional regulator [Mycobacteroides abscessus]SKY48965.1 putative ATPase [Mycobacteroides abscessus subsp. bolletii]